MSPFSFLRASQFAPFVALSADMSEADEPVTSLGTHQVHIDGDRIFLTIRGTLRAEDVQGLFRLAIHVKTEHPFAFFLYDGRQGTGIDPDARRAVSSEKSPRAQADLRVVFGLSFRVRMILNMLVRAQKALFNRDMRIHIFEHEKEAREFFEAECDRIRTTAGQSIRRPMR